MLCTDGFSRVRPVTDNRIQRTHDRLNANVIDQQTHP